MIDGSVTVGPNAALNFSREGYGKINFSLRDIKQMFSFSGFWKLILKSWKPGLAEIYSSLNKNSYLKVCQKYCPSLELADLEPYRSGVRAQAVSKNGELIHDFLVEETRRSLHVCNAPSPAATSSLPIGKYIVELVDKKLGRK
jgi:L-2-hydroxyglutarate oxidase